MRASLIAYEDLVAGDMVSVKEGFAGRVAKTRITGDFVSSCCIGMVQNTTAAGNVCVVTTDGPSRSNLYPGKLIPGEDYYVGIAAQLVTFSQLKSSLVGGSYTEAYMVHVGLAASTDQLALDIESSVYVIPSAL